MTASANSPALLSRLDKSILAVLLLVVIGFGAMTLYRSAYLNNRRTDVGCFFRAGWAIREGTNPYDVTDNNNWHYTYPVLFAIVNVPLADPPDGVSREGSLPYPVSVVIFYVISVAGIWWAAHLLAQALETAGVPRGRASVTWRHRAWWTLRVAPIVAMAPDIGSTLGRGQTNGFLMLAMVGAALALVRGRSYSAGLCIAAGTVLKVIPGFMLVYAVWRRDWRMLVGFGAGMVLGLVVIPAATIGPAKMWQYNNEWLQSVGLPGLSAGSAAERKPELHDLRGSSNQETKAILYNWTYLGVPKKDAPLDADGWMKIAHLVFGLLFTGATLWAIGGHGWFGKRKSDGAAMGVSKVDEPLRIVLAFGMLAQAMLLISPVTHIHYMMMIMPSVAGLLWAWGTPNKDGGLNRRGFVLIAVLVVAMVLPKVGKPFDVLRWSGWIPLVGIAVWALAAVEVRKMTRRSAG